MESALRQVEEAIENSRNPIILAGSHIRSYGALDAFHHLADALGFPVAVQPNAKGLFSEDRPQFIGVYWGAASTPGGREAVENADLILSICPV